MPQTSTIASTIGGALTIIIVWVVQTWGHVDIPAGVASAFTTIIMALLTQFVPDRKA